MRSITLYLFVSIGFTAVAQEDQQESPRNYLGVSAGLQTAELGSPLLKIFYSRGIQPKWWLSTSFSYQTFGGQKLMNESLLYADSSIQIYRDQEEYHRSYLLNVGAHYRPIQYLNFGMEIVMGYNQGHISLSDRAKSYDSETGEWFWDSNAISKAYPDLFQVNNVDQTSISLRGGYDAYLGFVEYLVSGCNISVGGRLPIGNRWEIKLDYAASFLRYTYLNNHSLATELNYEGMEVYPNIEQIVTEGQSFNLLNHSLNLGVGFGF